MTDPPDDWNAGRSVAPEWREGNRPLANIHPGGWRSRHRCPRHSGPPLLSVQTILNRVLFFFPTADPDKAPGMDHDHLATPITFPPSPNTKFRDTLQPSDHQHQPLTDPLLPAALLKLARNAYIELKLSKSNHEVPYNDKIVNLLEELVPQADLRLSVYRFKLAKSDTMGLRDVNVEGGLEYAQTKAYRDHKDWVERGGERTR